MIDGKCNTCGQTMTAPEANSRGEDESTLRLKIKELEDQLRQAQQRFEDHTEHVSRFLGEMYAVMIDPLDSSSLKVAEMTATLLDAAKRDRETANLHADALGALQDQLRREREAKDRALAAYDRAMESADKGDQREAALQAQVARTVIT